jgi:hypothetical protein
MTVTVTVMRMFCNNFRSSVLFVSKLCSPMLSRAHSAFQLYGCVSFYTQLRSKFCIYCSSPLLFKEVLVALCVLCVLCVVAQSLNNTMITLTERDSVRKYKA